MPRNYQRKKDPPSYTLEDLSNAVSDVQNRNKTYREAEDFYGVPKSVIYQRIGGRKSALNLQGAGRRQTLSAEIESEIVQCIQQRIKMGIPCDKMELRKLVGEYVVAKNLKTPFKEGIPGEDWYYGFMGRHPELSLKKPEHLQKLRKDARKPEIIYQFYEDLEKVLDENNLKEDKGEFIYNADESGFNNDPSRIRAIGLKGKALSRVSGGSGRESTTVLACVSANGKALPPLIVFKGAGVQARWTSANAYPGTLYAASTNGWMEEPQFYNWFTTCCILHVEQVRAEKNLPDQAALLLYDGHASHISVRIIEEAMRHNIILIKFPSHLTDKLQPLDKCVFGPLKITWNRHLVKYGKEQMGQGCGRLTREKFSELLGITWQESMLSKNIISGFIHTGIYPIDAKKFPQDEFNPVDLAKYQNSKLINDSKNDNQTPLTCTSSTTSAQPELPLKAVNVNEPSISTTTCVQSRVPIKASIDTEHVNSIDDGIVSTSSTTNSPPTQKPTTSCFQKIYSNEPITDISLKNIFMPAPKLPENNFLPKKVVPRLKQLQYGEVLTTNQVLNRLKEAKEKKLFKGTKLKNSKKENKAPGCSKAIDKISKSSKTNLEKFVVKPKSKKSRKDYVLDSDDSSSDQISLGNSDEDIDWTGTENPDIEMKEVELSELSKGKFILAQFKGGKRNATIFKYVCLIESVEGNDILITGLKSWDSSKCLFNIVETDVSIISADQVLGVLPNPNIQMKGERILYAFSAAVPVNE